MPCENIQPQLNLEGEAEASPVQPKNVQPAPMGKRAEGRRKTGPKMQNLTGSKVDAWTVIEHADTTPAGASKWLCRCQCGTMRVITRIALLRNGIEFKSCGCCPEQPMFHGRGRYDNPSPELRSWRSMRRRCNYPKAASYKNYGARGIRVCDRWQNSFLTFLEDMGPKPKGTFIDRIDNDGNYEPGNCRWATKAEQVSNNRRNRFASLNGETKTASQWARQYGFTPTAVLSRLKMGWSIEDAVSKPLNSTRGDSTRGTRKK